MNAVRRTTHRIWPWPIFLSLLIIAGLLSALLGQTGFWLPLSWVLLGTPLCVIAIAAVRAKSLGR